MQQQRLHNRPSPKYVKGESYAVNPINGAQERNYGGLPPNGLHRAAGENLIHGAASPRGLNANNARPPLPTNYMQQYNNAPQYQ